MVAHRTLSRKGALSSRVNHLNFSGHYNHIFGTAKVRVVKFRKQVNDFK